jgi:hypothetical protein
MPIPRSPIIDDDGSGTTGTVIDNAWKQELYNQIDSVVAPGGTNIGYWFDVPFNAANFFGYSGMVFSVTAANVPLNRYTVIGKTLIWTVNITAGSLSGTPNVQFYCNLPGGLVSVGNRGGNPTATLYDGAHNLGYVKIEPSGYALAVLKQTENNFALTAGGLFVRFTAIIEVN